MRTSFVGPDDPAWSGALAGIRHDFYHLPEYVQFATRRQEPGEALAFVAEDAARRFFVPLIVRPVPAEAGGGGTLRDAACPRGYPGPLASVEPGPDGERFVGAAVAMLVEGLRDRGIVSAFVRLHPLLSPSPDILGAAGAVVDHGDSVSIDLRLAPEDLRRQTRENHRRDIRTAQAAGYAARIDEGWERFEEFVEVYAQSMRRLGAGEAWSHSRPYFDDLRATLGSAIRLCVVEAAGELASAALLTEVDGIVEYHLAGTADRHVRASPSKLVVDFARWWARDRGNRVLHLAGSLRRGDPLSRFKLGFSPLLHPVCSWRLVPDVPTYDALVRAARTTTPAGAHQAGFFPAYRAGRS